jgi:hypothetical protein
MKQLFNIFFGLLRQGFALPRNDIDDFNQKPKHLLPRNDKKRT